MTSKSLALFNRASSRRGVGSLASGQCPINITGRRYIYTTPHFAFAQQPAPTRRVDPPRATIAGIGFQQKSFISTTQPRSVFGWVQDKLSERAKTKKAAKLVDQIALMANSPTWTVKMFADEIDETLSSWTTKIPGAGRTSELQAARESQKVVNVIIDQLGGGITAADMSKFDRKQKLKLAIACKKPMEDLEMVLNSFTQMDIMHRILRYRKENGIPLPTDDAGLKLAMQQDGMKVMTKEEKHKMRQEYAKYMESQNA